MAASPSSDAAGPPWPGGAPALWVLVVAGPAARAALLGGMLVAQSAIGKAFGLDDGVLAILFECIVFGSLLAVFVLPPLVRFAGLRPVSLIASLATVGLLATGIALAPDSGAGTAATAGLFAAATLTGFSVAVLSPVTQTLLNNATMSDPARRESLQSAWSAGQPVGFVLASFVGGVLVDSYGWWTALAVPLLFAAVCTVALLDRRVTASAADSALEDPGPALRELVTILVVLVAFEIWSSWGSLTSWGNPGPMLALAATLAAAAFAVRRLRRSQSPGVSTAAFGVPGFAAAFVILLLYQFPTTAEFEVLLLTELDHLSSAEIGNRTALGNIGQVLGTALAAALMLRSRHHLALMLGFALTLVGMAGYVAYPWYDSFAYVTATRALAGFGSGLLTPVLFVLALARMPAHLHLPAGSWLVIALIGGTEIGLALFDIVLDLTIAATGSRLTGYLVVETAQLAVAAATAVLAALILRRGGLSLAAGPTGGTVRPPF